MIRCKRIYPDAKLPTRAHPTDAGLDLYAQTNEPRRLTMKVGTGVAVEIPPGYVGLVLPRSSMNAGGVMTHVGVVDSGYCGEIFVVLSEYRQNVLKGMRIAQLVIVPCLRWGVIEEDFAGGERGANGFGSTGE